MVGHLLVLSLIVVLDTKVPNADAVVRGTNCDHTLFLRLKCDRGDCLVMPQDFIQSSFLYVPQVPNLETAVV